MVSPGPSLELDDVRKRYSDAARRLSEIAEAAAGLTKASGQLDSARGSLSEAATTFVEIAEQHQVLLEETRRVIESVSSLDPAALHALLKDVNNQTVEIGDQLGTNRQANADVAARVEVRDAELLELMRETSQHTTTGVKALHALLEDVNNQTVKAGNELDTSKQANADVAARVEVRDAELLELMQETSKRTKTSVKIAVVGVVVAVAALAGVAWIILGPLAAT
jgi:chromosome segregation ATPase